MLGTALWMQGRMAESAETYSTRAVEAARLVDNMQGLAWNLFNRSFAALAAGDVELALADRRGERRADGKDLDESAVVGRRGLRRSRAHCSRSARPSVPPTCFWPSLEATSCG